MTPLGAIEAGGTKFVCAVGGGPYDIVDRTRIPTTTPDETLSSVRAFFDGRDMTAVGIATFGPVELRPDRPDFGHITTTPKPGWAGADLVGVVSGVPVAIDTDVNGAALAEWQWGAGRGRSSVLYVTVGTGLGGGAVIDGVTVRGLGHPEMGHVSVVRMPGDRFEGVCPYHGDCLEGMASGPAMRARWGSPAESLGDRTSEAVRIEAHYLASGLRQLVYTLAPGVVVLGGGVSHLPGLHRSVNERLVEEMAGYAVLPEHRSDFVVPPGLGDDAGIAGAFALAMIAA